MRIKSELIEAFNEGVRRYFHKLAREYSCRLSKIDDHTFHLVHKNYFVEIGFFESHEPAIHITIHPNRKIYTRLGEDWHGLGFIASVLVPESDFGPTKFKKEKDVLLSLEKQAQILVICCGKMLKSDFSQWRRLNMILKERVREAEQRREDRLNKL